MNEREKNIQMIGREIKEGGESYRMFHFFFSSRAHTIRSIMQIIFNFFQIK